MTALLMIHFGLLCVHHVSYQSPNFSYFGLVIDLQTEPQQARIQDPARTLAGGAEGRHHARHRVAWMRLKMPTIGQRIGRLYRRIYHHGWMIGRKRPFEQKEN